MTLKEHLQNCRTDVITHHPLLLEVTNGKFSKKQLALYTRQQAFLSVSFASCIALIHSRMPYLAWPSKKHLLPFLSAKTWNDEDAGNHSQSFFELCAYLGLEISNVLKFSLRPYTNEFITGREQLCQNPNFVAQGVAALIIDELLSIHIFGAFAKGLSVNWRLKDCPINYFQSRADDEVDNLRSLNYVYLACFRTEKNCFNHDVKSAMDQYIRLRTKQLDGLWQDWKKIKVV